MFEIRANVYSSGHLVATDLPVWVKPAGRRELNGMFHIPCGMEMLPGGKYHIEVLPEKMRLGEVPEEHEMDIVITEVSDPIAHFALKT